MELLRKIFASSVIFVTVLSMSAVAAPAGAAAVAGDLIKMNGLSTVYYLGADGKRYVFPNEKTYNSWYKDFSGVVTIAQSELESMNLGGNVTVRPGTKLVKITTNPNVYAVEPGGNLRSIVSEANAIALWGANWAQRVIDVPDGFFTNYKVGSALTTGAYSVGSLVKTSSSADVYYFDGTNYRKFASEAAFSANGFDMGNVVTTSMAVTAGGTTIAGKESALADTSSGSGGTAGAGTGLTVALSASTAPANTIIAGQSVANLASFNFTAANDGAVSITTLKLKKIGITSDATLASVYLYDGNTRISDSASVSSGYVNFSNMSGVVNVPAGTTKTISVKANIAASTGGQSVGVAINAASDVTTNGASVSGSFPANANIMSIANVTDFATVNIATSSPTPTTNSAVDVQNDYNMWQDTVTVGQRAIDLNYFALREIGSVSAGDLGNFRLYVDGVQVGSAVASMDANGYVAFDLNSAPKRIETGSRIFKMVGDVKGGSTRNFSFSLRQASDIVTVDSQYNANVLATVNSLAFTSCTTGVQTVSSGTLTVTKTTDSPSSNVIVGGSGVSLAKYTLHAAGEPIKIETLTASVAASYGTASLRNGALFANGVQVGSTANLTTAGTQFTVNYTVNPGTDVTLEVRADIYDTASSSQPASGTTLAVSLATGASNAQGVNSFSLMNVPTGTATANTLSVTTGTMTLSKTGSYGNQSIVVPQTVPVKLGSYVLTGNASEDINLNTITVDFNASGTFEAADLSDVYVSYGGTLTNTKSAVSATGNSWSISKVLAKNTSVTIEVYGKIGSTITTGDSVTSDMTITGTTAQSGQSSAQNDINGQVIQAAAGTLSTSALTTLVSRNLVGGQAVDVAEFKFTAVNDSYTITEVVATTSASGATAIVTASLMDGATVLKTVPFNGTTVTFSGLNVAVSANSSKTLKVNLTLGSIGTGYGTTGANIQTTLSTYKAQTSGGTQKIQTDESAWALRQGNAMYAYKSVPTVSVADTTTNMPIGTGQTVAKFTIASDVNTINWKTIVLAISKASAPTLGTTTFALYDGATPIGGSWTVTAALGTTGIAAGTAVFTATTEQPITGSKLYTVKATVGGTIPTNEYITTSVANGVAVHSASVAQGSVSGSATFVWSDQSSSTHDESTSTDWTDEFLLMNIPTGSYTLKQ